MQRPTQLALCALAIELVGLGQRVGIDRKRGVDAVFVHADSHQVLLHQLARRDLALGHCRLHLRNGRLDHVEASRALGSERTD